MKLNFSLRNSLKIDKHRVPSSFWYSKNGQKKELKKIHRESSFSIYLFLKFQNSLIAFQEMIIIF